jgi:hypothetical protein
MMDPLKIHPIFFSKEATSFQKRLYSRRFHGVSSREQNEEKADATLVLAIAQVIQEGEYREVSVLVPENLKTWVSGRIIEMAKTCTNTLKSDPRKKVTLPIARKLLESIKPRTPNIGKILMTSEPPCWVAIGYSREDILPAWLMERLM